MALASANDETVEVRGKRVNPYEASPAPVTAAFALLVGRHGLLPDGSAERDGLTESPCVDQVR